MSRLATIHVVVFVVAPACGGGAAAKERHLGEVRALLVSRAARCNSCHLQDDGEGLNAYGQALKSLASGESLGDRIAAIEGVRGPDRRDPEQGSDDDVEDVDRDGVANWIEILAQTSPDDAEAKPEPAVAERIEAVVSCGICHRAVNLPGGGLQGNPHNEFGNLLAQTVPRAERRRLRGEEALREAAQRLTILARLELAKTVKPRRSRATYWEKLRLLHAPADADDHPATKELTEFRRQVIRQRRTSTRDATLGLDCEAHPVDDLLSQANDLP